MITHPCLAKPSVEKTRSDKVEASIFEEFHRNNFGRFIAAEAIEQLLKKAPCPWVFLSYSLRGRAAAEELNKARQNQGKLVETMEADYKKNVMASMKWTRLCARELEEPNKEFLFLIRK